MISHAILQFLESVEWGNLDYLIIDTPPGTSDAALTLMQLVQLDGVIIVSTPHPVSLTDAKKAINMAKQMNVPVLGIIENMAGDIFGLGVEKLAESSDIPFLGTIELNKKISKIDDVPVVKKDKNLRKDFENIVKRLLLHQQKD